MRENLMQNLCEQCGSIIRREDGNCADPDCGLWVCRQCCEFCKDESEKKE